MGLIKNIFDKIPDNIGTLSKLLSFKENTVFLSYFFSGTRKFVKGKHSKIELPCHVRNGELGNYSYVSMNSWISGAKIGKFCSIGPNFFCGWGIHPTNGISTAPMFYSTRKQNGITLSSIDKLEEKKGIIIGNDVFIGANVTILDGVNIGDGAVIGAGAVVSKDIPPYAIAVGVPITIIKHRFDKDTIQKLLQIKWWNFPEEKLVDVERYFFNIEKFIEKYKTTFSEY